MKTEGLNKTHFRNDFNCGNVILDNYLKKQANQDIKKKLAACLVYIEVNNNIQFVKGYFTLSNFGLSRNLIPENISEKFPKSFLTIPTTLIGRLGRDKNCAKARVGEFLLTDALHKTYKSSIQIASFAVVVDPINSEAESFYSKYGFKLLDSKKMFLPMATIAKLFTKN